MNLFEAIKAGKDKLGAAAYGALTLLGTLVVMLRIVVQAGAPRPHFDMAFAVVFVVAILATWTVFFARPQK